MFVVKMLDLDLMHFTAEPPRPRGVVGHESAILPLMYSFALPSLSVLIIGEDPAAGPLSILICLGAKFKWCPGGHAGVNSARAGAIHNTAHVDLDGPAPC